MLRLETEFFFPFAVLCFSEMLIQMTGQPWWFDIVDLILLLLFGERDELLGSEELTSFLDQLKVIYALQADVRLTFRKIEQEKLVSKASGKN